MVKLLGITVTWLLLLRPLKSSSFSVRWIWNKNAKITLRGMAEHRFSILFNNQWFTLLLYFYNWIQTYFKVVAASYFRFRLKKCFLVSESTFPFPPFSLFPLFHFTPVLSCYRKSAKTRYTLTVEIPQSPLQIIILLKTWTR